MKKINFLVIALAALSLPVAVSAKEDRVGAIINRPVNSQEVINIKNKIGDLRKETEQSNKTSRAQFGQSIEALKLEGQAEVKDLRNQLDIQIQNIKNDEALTPEAKNQAITDKREEAKRLIQQRTEAFQESLTEKRAEFEKQMISAREEAQKKLDTQKSDLQEKIKNLRDENKKVAAQKAADEFQKINDNQVKSLARTVDNLENILKNISSRANKAELAGKDVTVVKEDIIAATKAISDVRAAIKSQAGKTYAFNVTTDATLKANIQKSRQIIFNDIKILKDALKTAHDIVIKAAKDLSQIQGVNETDNDGKIKATAPATGTATNAEATTNQ